MAWLMRDGAVLATLEQRRPNWQESIQGALVLRGPCVIHTLTAPAALDVAWCSRVPLDEGKPGWQVRRIGGSRRRRTARLQPLRGALVVAPSGAFDRWGLHIGDVLEVRGG